MESDDRIGELLSKELYKNARSIASTIRRPAYLDSCSKMLNVSSMAERIDAFKPITAHLAMFENATRINKSFGAFAALESVRSKIFASESLSRGLTPAEEYFRQSHLDKTSPKSIAGKIWEMNNHSLAANSMIEGLRNSGSSKMHELLHGSSMAASVLAKYNWDLFSATRADEANTRNRLGFTVSNYTKQYNKVGDLVKSNPALFKDLSPEILRIPPVEIINTLSVVKSLSGNDCRNEEDGCEVIYENAEENITTLHKLLPKLNPKLLTLWTGANDALKSRSEDKVRHVSTSLRELFTHVLHEAAPDKKVKEWSTEEKYYSKGKPTREARLHYITLNVNRGGFGKLIELDVKIVQQLFDLLNGGTHSLDETFSNLQLACLIRKVESTLIDLLTIHFHKSNID